MSVERGSENPQHLRIGDQVPLSIHLFQEGGETSGGMCSSTTGNNPMAGKVISYLLDAETSASLGLDIGRLVRAQCNVCEYEEDIATLPSGKTFKSGTGNPLIPK